MSGWIEGAPPYDGEMWWCRASNGVIFRWMDATADHAPKCTITHHAPYTTGQPAPPFEVVLELPDAFEWSDSDSEIRTAIHGHLIVGPDGIGTRRCGVSIAEALAAWRAVREANGMPPLDTLGDRIRKRFGGRSDDEILAAIDAEQEHHGPGVHETIGRIADQLPVDEVGEAELDRYMAETRGAPASRKIPPDDAPKRWGPDLTGHSGSPFEPVVAPLGGKATEGERFVPMDAGWYVVSHCDAEGPILLYCYGGRHSVSFEAGSDTPWSTSNPEIDWLTGPLDLDEIVKLFPVKP